MEKKVKDRINALKSRLAAHTQNKLDKTKGSIYNDIEYNLKIRIEELEKLIK
tara:strand:+ start:562 stop:717 length:156 start_codon:yes stop_codon:yes gene_type:complete